MTIIELEKGKKLLKKIEYLKGVLKSLQYVEHINGQSDGGTTHVLTYNIESNVPEMREGIELSVQKTFIPLLEIQIRQVLEKLEKEFANLSVVDRYDEDEED